MELALKITMGIVIIFADKIYREICKMDIIGNN